MIGGCREGWGRCFLGWESHLSMSSGLGMQLGSRVLAVGLGDVVLELLGMGCLGDRPYVFPSSVVPFAFGLHDVTLLLGSLIDDSPWDVLIICRDLNNTSWLGPRSGSSLVPWILSKCVFCVCFFDSR